MNPTLPKVYATMVYCAYFTLTYYSSFNMWY
jgi:hypothetical protein